MAEDNITKKSGIERQTEILVAALERAGHNDGILLNTTEKAAPNFYGRQMQITPVNALVMAMHSDAGGFRTNSYTMFNEAHDRNEAVRKGQKGVPFVWVNLNQYVSKEDAQDKISRAKYNTLSDADKERYKVQPREDVYTLFNVDQTTMPHVHKDEYSTQLEKYGAGRPRDDKQLHMAVNKFLQSIKDNLVPIRKDATGIAHYDAGKDTLYIPAQKNYPSYADYLQEVSRLVVRATGAPQRLGRNGTAEGAPSKEQQREMLVEELASAHKMLELGLPAKMRPETIEQLPSIIASLKEDPKMAQKMFRDVNRTVGMIRKAENGEKILPVERPSWERRQTWSPQLPTGNVPETFSNITMLKDDAGKWTLVFKPENDRTYAVRPSREDVSMYFDTVKNGQDKARAYEFRKEFAQKYYSVLAQNPGREAVIFKSEASQEALDLIHKVSVFKSKNNNIYLAATIGDDRQKSVPVSRSQWQRLWLADDRQDYKTHLAATLYSDVIARKLGGMTQSQSTVKEDTLQKQEQEQGRQEKKGNQENQEQKQQLSSKMSEAETGRQLPPVIRQFDSLKQKHPDAILLFRCGDFYETYRKDAEKAAKILGITLTRHSQYKDSDGKGISMTAFPSQAIDTYLPKLIRAGERIAICDQVEQQRQADNKEEKKEEAEQSVPLQKEVRHGMHR